jgi:hypothetical protein
MQRTYKDKVEVIEVLKEALWLAWKAAGGTSGMGFLQDNPDATKEDVWDRVHNPGDYVVATSQPQMLHADYVFGRMLKLRVEYTDTTITVDDAPPRRDYQSWCGEYRTYDELLTAAEQTYNE